MKSNRDYLKESNLGTYQSAASFLEVLKIVLVSSEEDMTKTLKNKKNEPILLVYFPRNSLNFFINGSLLRYIFFFF